MRRVYLLSLLLLPGLAFADNRGELAFKRACASCHITGHTAKKQRGAKALADANKKRRGKPADYRELRLGKLLKKRTPEQLQAWLRGPQNVRPDARCDTRHLQPAEVDSLLNYLATSARPPPPSREQLLRQNFQKNLAARRARQQDKAKVPSSTTQGKK